MILMMMIMLIMMMIMMMMMLMMTVMMTMMMMMMIMLTLMLMMLLLLMMGICSCLRSSYSATEQQISLSGRPEQLGCPANCRGQELMITSMMLRFLFFDDDGDVADDDAHDYDADAHDALYVSAKSIQQSQHFQAQARVTKHLPEVAGCG